MGYAEPTHGSQEWQYRQRKPSLRCTLRQAQGKDDQRVKKTSNVDKYDYFNGQPIALRRNGTLYYLHQDELGNLVLVTSGGAGVSAQGFYAYGKLRSGFIGVERSFTGQQKDLGTGLIYFNARYYDPELGAFLSPDTVVPDGGNLFDYNRYMYGLGNPLKFNDPSGHCVNATTTNKPDEITYNNDDCWRFANTIGAMWDSTDYWSNRFASKDVFFTEVANNGYNDTDFFQGQLTNFLSSDDGGQWLHDQPVIHVGDVDFGDYWSINGSAGVYELAFIIDDFSNVYFRTGPGAGSPGIAIRRGDVLVPTSDGSEFIDIDLAGLTRAEKSELMREVMPGLSSGVGGGIVYASVSLSTNIPPSATFIEAGGTFPLPYSWSYAPTSQTWYLFTLFK